MLEFNGIGKNEGVSKLVRIYRKKIGRNKKNSLINILPQIYLKNTYICYSVKNNNNIKKSKIKFEKEGNEKDNNYLKWEKLNSTELNKIKNPKNKRNERLLTCNYQFNENDKNINNILDIKNTFQMKLLDSRIRTQKNIDISLSENYSQKPIYFQKNENINKKIKYNNNSFHSVNLTQNNPSSLKMSFHDKYISPEITNKNFNSDISFITNLYTSTIKNNSNNLESKNKFFLPPQKLVIKPKKTLILDLDETLIHSSFKELPFDPDMKLKINFEKNKNSTSINIMKRPYVNIFLHKMSFYYEIVIFTASVSEYANPLIDQLDIYNDVSHRLFREHCIFSGGIYIKDLSKLGRNLKDCIIIDNNPLSFLLNKYNGITIKAFHYDKNDKELLKLLPLLKYLAYVDDVREVIKKMNDKKIVFNCEEKVNNNFKNRNYSSNVFKTRNIIRNRNNHKEEPIRIYNLTYDNCKIEKKNFHYITNENLGSFKSIFKYDNSERNKKNLGSFKSIFKHDNSERNKKNLEEIANKNNKSCKILFERNVNPLRSYSFKDLLNKNEQINNKIGKIIFCAKTKKNHKEIKLENYFKSNKPENLNINKCFSAENIYNTKKIESMIPTNQNFKTFKSRNEIKIVNSHNKLRENSARITNVNYQINDNYFKFRNRNKRYSDIFDYNLTFNDNKYMHDRSDFIPTISLSKLNNKVVKNKFDNGF